MGVLLVGVLDEFHEGDTELNREKINCESLL